MDCSRYKRYVLTMVCLAGFVIQSSFILSDYFLYETKTMMDERALPRARLNAFALCIPYHRKTNDSFDNMTIAEVRENVPAASEVIDSCILVLPDNRRVSCFHVSRVRTYTDSFWHCFALFETRDLKIGASRLIYNVDDIAATANVVIRLKVPSGIRISKCWMIKIYKSYFSLTFRRYDHGKQCFQPQTYKYVGLGFTQASSNNLPPPYSSKCFDYRVTEYRTREKRLDFCYLKYMRTDSGEWLWPPFVFADNETSNQLMQRRAATTEEIGEHFPTVTSRCWKELPARDCIDRLFDLDIRSYQYTDNPFSGVNVKLAFFPRFRREIRMLPMIEFADVLIAIGGLGSVWLGFSVFVSMTSLCDRILTLMSRKEEISVRSSEEHHDVKARCFHFVQEGEVCYPTKQSSWKRRLGKKVITAAIVASCVTGMTIHIWDIVNLYIHKPFTYHYRMEEPSRTFFPTLNLCVKRLVNETKLKLAYPDAYAKLPNNLSHSERQLQISYLLTLAQQMETTTNIIDLIYLNTSEFHARDTQRYEKISKYYNMEKKINWRYVCFETFSRETALPTTRHEKYSSDHLSLFKWLNLFTHPSQQDQLDVYLNFHSDIHPSPGSLEKHVILVNPASKLNIDRQVIYFKRTERLLFQGHMHSQCINYLRSYGRSRESLLSSCLLQTMTRRFGELPHDAFINSSSGDSRYRFSSDAGRVRDVTARCNARLPLQDCRISFMEIQTEATYAYGRLEKGQLNLVLYPPGAGSLQIKQVLRIPLVELIAFCAGVIGVWMGWSVLHLSTILFAAGGKCHRIA